MKARPAPSSVCNFACISQTHKDTVTPNTLRPCIHFSDDKENITIFFARPVHRLLSAYTRSCTHFAVHLISVASELRLRRQLGSHGTVWQKLARRPPRLCNPLRPCISCGVQRHDPVGGGADAAEGPPRRAQVLHRRLEHRQQALPGVGRFQRGARVRVRRALVRRGRGGGGSSSYSYSRRVFALSLLLLLVFTAAAVIGCAVLYDGQGKFNGSTTATLDYVVRQADGAAATMRNFTGLLQTAKTVGGGVASLPPDVARSIDDVARRVDAASDELTARAASNSRRIRTALDTIRKVLIGVAAVMLVLVLVGSVFSLTGKKSLVSIVVFLGWMIITATLILSGTFLLLHNVIGDTCVAMDEWVVQPQGQSHTALDDILPCADAAVTAEALRRSKEVNFQLVTKLNELVSNVSNRDVPAQVGPPLYYNQSGPLVALLCSPYNSDLSDRPCAAGEVAADNAQQVWQRYVCRATGSSGQEVCSTVGRLTPAMYSQMVTVAGLSDGLRGQSPALADIASCVTVRRAFQTVSQRGCPPLRRDSSRVYQALLAASVAAMLAAAAWVVHSRERRRRRESERFKVSPYRLPIEDKVLLSSPRRPYRRV